MIFCFDIDGVICENKTDGLTYATVKPFPEAIAVLKELKEQGHTIILYTGRHMKTCEGNTGKVLARQGKILLDWLEKYEIPFDEIYMNKPHVDLFIDDAAHHHTDWPSSIQAINERIKKGPRGPENP